jgi:hypothetical protein
MQPSIRHNVKLSLAELEDDMNVMDILDHFMKTSGLHVGTQEGAKAYNWMRQQNGSSGLRKLTWPRLPRPALKPPHYVRICHRKDLGTLIACMDGTAEAAACHRAEHRGYQPNGNDVVMVVKDRMASLEVSQIILMVPVADLGRLHGLPLQPQGTHLRRPASERDRKRVHEAALMVHHVVAISRKACNYLSHWAQGTRRRLPRPAYYHSL